MINELDLLEEVWAMEKFKNYLLGMKVQIVSDYEALASVLNGNNRNTTYSIRLLPLG